MANVTRCLILALLAVFLHASDAFATPRMAHRHSAHKLHAHALHKKAKSEASVQWDAAPAVEGERMFTAFPSTFSTINPTIPVAGSSLLSAPIRANFAAAYADINNLYTQLSTPLNFLTAGTGVAISATGTVSLATIPANTLWANPTALAAVPASTTLTAYLDSVFSPAAAGSVVYRGVSVWQAGVLPTTSGASTAFAPAAASGGSANALTFTTGNPSSWTLLPNNSVCGVVTATNTAAATLSVNGTTATAINARSTTGLSALAGGELRGGQVNCFVYDGTVWELMSAVNAATEVQAGNYTAVQGDSGDFYAFTAASPTLTLPLSTTVGSAWKLYIYAYGGPVTITPNAADTLNGGGLGVSVALPQFSWSEIYTDAAGHFFATGMPIQNGQLAPMATLTVKGNVTGGAAVPADLTVAQVQNIEGVFTPPQGRLTLSTGVPVMTASVSASATVYYTPYVGGMVPIYNGATVQMFPFTEMSQATTDATKSPAAVAASSCYDVFVWSDAGTLRATRGPVWTSVTARSAGTALTILNTTAGRSLAVNAVAITNGPGQFLGTYVGTICSNAGSTIDYIFGGSASGGTAAVFNVWNMYNRINVSGTVQDNGVSYTYGTVVWREARASTTNMCRFVVGVPEDEVWAGYTAPIVTGATAGNSGYISVGYDTTSTNSGEAGQVIAPTANALTLTSFAQYSVIPAIGQHTFTANELGRNGTATFGANDAQYPTMICRMRM